MALPAALREAQLWLRAAAAADGDDQPFENPFYWAAFTFAGAG
jgi:CHAT domain-containing protein